jgi:hypothetical protein
MANLERGAYEPRIDKIPEFEPEDAQDGTEDGSRLPLLIVIALVVLAAFAGVVWLAYTQGVERGRADAPRVIVAAGNTSKSAGSQPAFTGLNIYQPSSAARSSTRHPESRFGTTRASNGPPALRSSATSAADSDETVVSPPTPSPASTAVSRPRISSPGTSTISVAPSVSARPAGPTSPARIQAPGNVEPVVAQTAKLQGVLLQIGSYRTVAEANQSWQAFKARHASVAGYQSDVAMVDLGAKGIWYRLRVGSFTDRKSAIAACEKLRAGGANCLIAR